MAAALAFARKPCHRSADGPGALPSFDLVLRARRPPEPMSFWSALLAEASADFTAVFLLGLAVVVPLHRRFGQGKVRHIRELVVLAVAHAMFVVLAAALRDVDPALYRNARFAALACVALGLVGIAGSVLFTSLLPRLALQIPKIVQDVLVGAVGLIALLGVASAVGYDVSGLLTTSAIVTAVIGLAMQDTIGNLVAGLALQSDKSIRIGDWIEAGQVSGRVTEIRWRYTAIETRNWETVYLPNGMLVKNQVKVVGRRDDRTRRWRRWVRFNVDFRFPPTDVIEAVEHALTRTGIPNVASDPPPHCILLELDESFARYAVRYWLLEPAADDATDSVIRVRIAFALRRAGIPLSMPAQAVFVTKETQERKAEKEGEEHARRLRALAQVDLFRDLSPEDRERLAAELRYVPFAAGEPITRQGAEAHWLYLLIEGEASVRIRNQAGIEREVGRIAAGSFFGEMSLLTGEKRSATVVALTDVECYRLDKRAFEQVVRERPAIAESVAELLARRQVELAAAREDFDRGATPSRLEETKSDLLHRIRSFFGLAEPDAEEEPSDRKAG